MLMCFGNACRCSGLFAGKRWRVQEGGAVVIVVVGYGRKRSYVLDICNRKRENKSQNRRLKWSSLSRSV
jgi:hypothetical protein